MIRAFLVLGLLGALQAQDIAAPDPAEIMKKLASRDQSNWERAKDYTYLSRQKVDVRDSKGNVKKSIREAHEILILFGQPYRKLVEKDGQPLTGDKLRKEQEKLDKLVAQRQKETPSEREKRLAEFEKERRKEREFALEIPKAFHFTLLGEEPVSGRPAWIIQAEPRREFHSTVHRGDILKKFRGKIWIDKADYQMVRIDAEVVDTVSFGWVLARLAKGSHFFIEQARINDEVWLPKLVQVKMDARVGLLVHMQGDVDVQFSNFRKFQTESKIVATAEPEQ